MITKKYGKCLTVKIKKQRSAMKEQESYRMQKEKILVTQSSMPPYEAMSLT